MALVVWLSRGPSHFSGDFHKKPTCLLILGKERKRALSGKEVKEIIGQQREWEYDQNTRNEKKLELNETIVQQTGLGHETY